MNQYMDTILRFVMVISAIYFAVPDQLCGQDPLISIGIKPTLDANFYKFYNSHFSDLDGRTKFRNGITYGLLVAIKPLPKWQIEFGYNRSIKSYKPERLFSFGILQSVEIRTIEITGNASYEFSSNYRKWKSYVSVGVDYEHEYDLKTIYIDHNGEDFLFPRNSLMPTIGFGLSTFINSNKRLEIRPEVLLRFRPDFREYLHPIINKAAVSLKLQYTIYKA